MLNDLSAGSAGSSGFADLAIFLSRLMTLMSEIQDSLAKLSSKMETK
jgi:hypothetical protein